MRYHILSYHQADRVIEVNLNDSGACYSNSIQTANELAELCGEISLDAQVQVAIIRMKQAAPPPNFNLKLPPLPFDPDKGSSLSWADPVSRLEIPVIMATDGYVLGQALELALACDIRIASFESYFGLPHIDEGIIPWDGGTQRLSRLVGASNALEMILIGEPITGEMALRMGLVNRLVDAGQLFPHVMDIARKMAAKAPIALKYTKEVVLKGMELTMDQALSLEADLYFLLHTSRDRAEGIKAFQEKRKANFEGK